MFNNFKKLLVNFVAFQLVMFAMALGFVMLTMIILLK